MQLDGDPPLDGCRVLIVEDDGLIALDLEGTFQDAGAEVDLATSLEAARRLVGRRYDLAVLDCWLRGEEVFPVADALRDLGVPILFHSGHLRLADIRGPYPDAVAVGKPSAAASLLLAAKQIAATAA